MPSESVFDERFDWHESSRRAIQEMARLMGEPELTRKVLGRILSHALGDELLIMQVRSRGGRIVSVEDGEMRTILPFRD